MALHSHVDHDNASFEITEQPGSLLRFASRDADGYVWAYANPIQVRQIHAALGQWLAEKNIPAEIAPALHVDNRVTAEDVRRIVQDELTKRFGKPPLPVRPLTREEHQEIREHTDHDGELWGALCKGCGHSRGAHHHDGGTCLYILPDMGYCQCEAFTDVRPAS